MSTIKTREDVAAYLSAVPADASLARRWQAVRTATRQLMRAHGMPNATVWLVEALPPQARVRYGDCQAEYRRIRYTKEFVEKWWWNDLSFVIAHEVAHAVTYHERQRQGLRGLGGHGPMWRGTAAAMGLRKAQAHNLPKEKK